MSKYDAKDCSCNFFSCDSIAFLAWHAYQIALETGEGLYLGIDVTKAASASTRGGLAHSEPKLKSKGIKQRIHPVIIEKNQIFVADSSLAKGS